MFFYNCGANFVAKRECCMAQSEEKDCTGSADIFSRTEMLLGSRAMARLAHCRVALFGVGGVGSWCAEALVRSGVSRLTVVDADRVAISNCNRQLVASSSTLGLRKVDVMRHRLLDINPKADITALAYRYTAETADSFHLQDYDFVVDAIDSLADKLHLILYVTRLANEAGSPRLVSSMGAARRLDPTQVRVADFWQVKGDPLAHALRRRMRHDNTLPACEFRCVYSTEPPISPACDAVALCGVTHVNASCCPVTATFGMTLAAELLHAYMH